MGPVLTGVPLRAKMGSDTGVEELMRELQRQTTRMLSHETVALQALAEHIGHRNVIQSVVNYRPPGSDSLAMDVKVGTEGACTSQFLPHRQPVHKSTSQSTKNSMIARVMHRQSGDKELSWITKGLKQMRRLQHLHA